MKKFVWSFTAAMLAAVCLTTVAQAQSTSYEGRCYRGTPDGVWHQVRCRNQARVNAQIYGTSSRRRFGNTYRSGAD
jgi:hypothetical protein